MPSSLNKQRLCTGKEKALTSASITISNCRVRGRIILARKKLISLRKKLRKGYSEIMSAF